MGRSAPARGRVVALDRAVGGRSEKSAGTLVYAERFSTGQERPLFALDRRHLIWDEPTEGRRSTHAILSNQC